MSSVIIYKQDNGNIAVVHPTSAALQIMTLQQIAEKDVPVGKPFKIIDSSFLPPDRSTRDAWTIDDAELTDGVGA